LLVIGLDGATLDLLEPWAAAGILPTFARLLRTGTHGRLRSVPNTDTAPAWATFATGLNPANHGLFHEFGWSADWRTLRPMRGADRRGQTFWRIASDAGRRVVVVNVPFTYPAEPVNGVLLAGIDAPGVDAPGFCHPPDFVAALRRDVGDYRIESQIQAAVKEGRLADGLADACAVAERQTETMIYALSQGEWDLAVIVYSIPDVIQHFFWQQMATGEGPQRHAIRDGYIFIEQQIERVAHTGDQTTVLVMSDHGFGPICATPEHLAHWLTKHGFLRYLDPARRPWRQRLVSNIYDWLRYRLSENQKAALRRGLPALRNRVESDARFAGIDWSATTAYVGPSPYEVWINCQGRAPQGSVAPGADYEHVREDLIAALMDWHDPVTGRQRVRAVYRREEVYHGRYLNRAPDVTIEWNPEAAPPADTLEGNASRFDADHQPEGILLAVGPGIRAGAEIRGATLADLAPTILHLLGVPMPGPMDGQILHQGIRDQGLGNQVPTEGPANWR
jgi:predicted AlkP superfamily phosphohydrolase/phosphomutase